MVAAACRGATVGADAPSAAVAALGVADFAVLLLASRAAADAAIAAVSAAAAASPAADCGGRDVAGNGEAAGTVEE